MIGKFTPKLDTVDNSYGIYEWKNGPFLKAIKKGYSVVFDNISSVPLEVIKGLNALFEPKDTEEDYYFTIPQNASKFIKIHHDFLFIATSTLEQIENLPQSFLNRFIVINLEDQLEGASEKEEKEAIKYIIESENIELIKKEEIIEEIYSVYKEDKLNMSKP